MGAHILRQSRVKRARTPKQYAQRNLRNLRVAYAAQFLSLGGAVVFFVYAVIGQAYYWNAVTALSVMGFILVTLFVGLIAATRRLMLPDVWYVIAFISTLVLTIADIAIGGSVY
jgi:hypothetical protein